MMKNIREVRSILMEFILGILIKICEKESVNLNGIMEKYMKDSGTVARRMVMEFGEVLTVTVMKVLGKMEGSMEKVSIRTRRVFMLDIFQEV